MSKFFAKTAAAALIVAGVVAPAMAQNASGSIGLKGNVALSCTVDVTDLSQSLSLKNGEMGKTIGNVTETCNSGTGYKVTLSSSNAGMLKSGNNVIEYAIIYDNVPAVLTSQLVMDRASAQFSKKSDLNIFIPASDHYIAGDYSDTITVAIAAK